MVDELVTLVNEALAALDARPGDIAAMATLESKAHEPAIVAAAAHFGVPVWGIARQALAAMDTPNPSAVVGETLGLESVAEAAVMVRGELLLAKRKSANATCAIGRLHQPPGAR